MYMTDLYDYVYVGLHDVSPNVLLQTQQQFCGRSEFPDRLSRKLGMLLVS